MQEYMANYMWVISQCACLARAVATLAAAVDGNLGPHVEAAAAAARCTRRPGCLAGMLAVVAAVEVDVAGKVTVGLKGQ